MKKNIYWGIGLYSMYILWSLSAFQVIEAVLLLSILIFLPVVYELLYTTKRDGSPLLFHTLIVKLYPLAAACALFAFVWESSLLAIVWWLYSMLLALFAVMKCLERGWRPLHELAIDSGFMYVVLGGFWVFASVAKLEWLGFSETIVLLTAVHFHYSSLFIPIFAGLVGRKMVHHSKWFQVMLVIIIISPMTVAIGITYSRVIEWLAVCVYLVSLYMYGFYVVKASFQSRMATLLVRLSAFILLITIAFSLIYAYGRLQYTLTISIETMVWIHGVANAVGVIFVALLGWKVEKTTALFSYYGKPMSRIYGLHNIPWLLQEKDHGLVDDMALFQSSTFHVEKLSPLIRTFYEQPESFSMQARIQWAGWFKPFAFLYAMISKKTKQIHLGMNTSWQHITGEIVPVDSKRDGRQHVRAWIRKNEQHETMFVALYSHYEWEGEVYMNIALPLPFSNMTGILRLQNEENHLLISSKSGLETGIYLHFPKWTITLPLSETFLIVQTRETELKADHSMKLLGVKFLHIAYQLTNE